MISNSIPSLDPLITNLIEMIWQCLPVKSLSRKYDCTLHCLEELIIVKTVWVSILRISYFHSLWSAGRRNGPPFEMNLSLLM